MKFKEYLENVDEVLTLSQADGVIDILVRTFEKQSKLTVYAPYAKNTFQVRFLIPKIEVELGSIMLNYFESTSSFAVSKPEGCAENKEFYQKIIDPVVKQLNKLTSSLLQNLNKS